ncbi:AraC family transcriptional regulator [Marinibaculum pumilum]|uniref:AraC family transcriptional regulator n=1 Tax=Marinibaculum pumilum TaxID=1766165 RepID=A0ABV7L882_9PROT
MSQPLAYIAGRFGRIGLVRMDTSLAVHVHRHIHLIVGVDGAVTQFQVRGRALPVGPDHAVLVEAWAPHGWRHRRGAPPTTFLTFYLEPDWVRDRLGFAATGDAALLSDPLVVLNDAARRSIAALAQLLSSAAGGAGTAGAEGGVDDLIAALLSAVLAGRAGRHLPLPVAVRLQDHRIRRAFGLLHDGARVEIEAVAREVGLSRPRFFELFRDCTGLTPGCVANAGRMERAIQGLTQSRQPLSDLALDLGYAAQGNFTRFFKQQIGISPASYRRAAMPVGLTGGATWCGSA